MAIFRSFVAGPSDAGVDWLTAHRATNARVPRLPWTVREYRLKRMIDVTVASAALVLSAPVWALIAAAIKLEDRGPVFFTQLRWGRGRQPFKVYKFRSMRVDADSRVQAGKDDSRFTWVGGLIRATSLDELPQLINIWRGEMSWVGPRALPINERQRSEDGDVLDEAVPGFDLRCSVRPGLTGIAQIFAPRDAPRRQKFLYDGFYIRRQSAWLVIRLILVSVWISFRLRWEERGPKLAGLRSRRVRARRPKGPA
jgi:lipopolysaccharide/colanic/teichoic acid biosynthesis glycosyltransferase